MTFHTQSKIAEYLIDKHVLALSHTHSHTHTHTHTSLAFKTFGILINYMTTW